MSTQTKHWNEIAEAAKTVAKMSNRSLPATCEYRICYLPLFCGELCDLPRMTVVVLQMATWAVGSRPIIRALVEWCCISTWT